jgi:pimeloyl-ACP methyl ester carboxylesterase
MRIWRGLFLSILACLVVAAFGRAASAQPTLQEYEARKAQFAAQTLPYIVFVPGVLGSKIQECNFHNAGCGKNIWGATLPNRDPKSLLINPNKHYRTDIVEDVFSYDVYGDALKEIESGFAIYDVNRLRVFHYDWRQSIGFNSAKLSEYLCGEVARYTPSTEVVILAHSMGGLVVKNWLKDNGALQCEFSQSVKIRKVVFIATPHLGAAKAARAVAEGYNLFLDNSDNLLMNVLGAAVNSIFLSSLNEVGLSFPSTFELLPVFSSESCAGLAAQAGKDISGLDIRVYGSAGAAIDIFDVQVWEALKLADRFAEGALSLSSIYAGIKDHLAKAEDLTCALEAFDPSTRTAVKHIVGKHVATPSRATIALRRRGPEVTLTLQPGDGTVEALSAANLPTSKPEQVSFVETAENSDHMSIVRSAAVRAEVALEFDIARKKIDQKLSEFYSRGDRPADPVLDDEFISVDFDPSRWNDAANQAAISHNAELLVRLNRSSDEYYATIYALPDLTRRLMLYKAMAATSDISEINRQWALTNAASCAFDVGDYLQAIVLANAAHERATNQPTKDSSKVIARTNRTKRSAQTQLSSWRGT